MLLLPDAEATPASVSLAIARAMARAVIPAISESRVFIAIASTFSTREVVADAESALRRAYAKVKGWLVLLTKAVCSRGWL